MKRNFTKSSAHLRIPTHAYCGAIACTRIDPSDEESLLSLADGYEFLQYALYRKGDLLEGRPYDLDAEGKHLSEYGPQSPTGQAYVD
jgi:hypothetical protein